MRCFLFVCVVLMASLTPARAQITVERATILEYGTFKANLVQRVPRASDPSGFANSLSDMQLLEQTDVVCARLGTRFGMTIRIEGKPAGSVVLLEIVNNYPKGGITNPKGEVFQKTRFPWSAVVGETAASIVFTFDDAWEMVPGTWTYDVEYLGKKIGSRSFQVMTTCETS